MAKLNLYKIDNKKKEDFLKNLLQKLDYVSKKDCFDTNQNICEIKLYNFFPDVANKNLSWNWLLNEFDEPIIKYKSNPKAVVTIEKGENLYVLTFGNSYFLVDKYCDKKFAFEFAKRTEYTDIKTTALNSPNSQRNKVINSYNKCANLYYDSGESYAKIKAKMNILKEEDRFNGTVEIGTSIRFSMKENTLENIIKIIEYVEETLKGEIIHNIPLFVEVTDDRIDFLDKKLVENIKEFNVDVCFSEFDIIGVNEVFNYNDSDYIISFGNKNKIVETINCEIINEFINENNIDDDNILKILIESNSEEYSGGLRELRCCLDYTNDEEKVVISKGVWYEYNDDYLKYLEDSLSELSVEYEECYDNFNNEYDNYIDIEFERIKKEYDKAGKDSSDLSKEMVKRAHYKERVFNILRSKNDGFINYDRDIKNNGGNKYELMDLYKDRTMYAVKIGNSSSKLCYALDQSLAAVKMLKSEKKIDEVEKVAVWFVLERKNKLKLKDNRIDLNSLDMLMLKNKIDDWQKKVKLAGFKPIVRINYIN